MTSYFYGIDFKKIKLFCKIKLDKILAVIDVYRTKKMDLKINYNRFYDIIEINFFDEIVKVEIDYIDRRGFLRSEERMIIELGYEMVEFMYFFNGKQKEDLNEVEL